MKSFEFESKAKSRPIVYLDMDGVLADFFGELKKRKISMDDVKDKKEFFSDLPALPNSGRLIHGVLKLAGKYSILSSPLMSEVDKSSEGKSEWLDEHLKIYQPQGVIFDHEKDKFARQANGTPNILIDDYETNINLWNSAGGIGILYKDDEVQRVLHELKLALSGKLKSDSPQLAVHEDDDAVPVHKEGQLYTNKQILNYVKGIHHSYHLEKPILKYKTWVLKSIPLGDLNNPEYLEHDDPYGRVIELDWEHIPTIHKQDIFKKPIVADRHGWVLDGNHRVAAARAAGLEAIPALVPYL
jgi:5'(3')-deoxyribonucleotidase